MLLNADIMRSRYEISSQSIFISVPRIKGSIVQRMKTCCSRTLRVLVRKLLLRSGLQRIVFVETLLILFILYRNWPLSNFFLDEEEDEALLTRYRPPPQSNVLQLGRIFDVNKTFWRRKRLKYLTLTAELAQDFVVVTAGSSGFYGGSLEAISTVQKFLPDRPVFFYDLEKRDKVNEYIAEKFGALCGVTYRQFDFSLYPDHVRKLRSYSWKPIIVYEMLKEFPGVLWIDSSIRFVTSNFSVIFRKAVESEGMLALTSAGHSNFAVTHPQMYSFLPTSEEGMIKTDQHEANCVLLYRTRPAFKNVVWWWMLCALDPLCIAPTDRTHCNQPYAARNRNANCHRFDQSALNILLANYFAFDCLRYYGRPDVAEIHRGAQGSGYLMVCRAGVMERTAGSVNGYLRSQPVQILPTPTLVVKRQNASGMGG